MYPQASNPNIPRAQQLAERARLVVEHYLHVEAFSGIVLLAAALAALVWANSPFAHSYEALWHASVVIGIGPYTISRSLHFWINDGLMTIFFLVVGMEIRREIHEGSLASVKLAALPVAAAAGGVVTPALIYLAINRALPGATEGWAIPTATDIAFAVGVLALLGRSIPGSVRIFLLALAVIDDLVAVLIIALFYSSGLDYAGFVTAGIAVAMTMVFQRAGIASAWAYVLPGAILWWGMLQTGAHPTLAGVVLGLMTPVLPKPMRRPPMELISRAAKKLSAQSEALSTEPQSLATLLREMSEAQRELLAPVTRVQLTLHPWVAYGVMPLFALANAGVSLQGIDLASGSAQAVLLGVLAALVLGKPLGVIAGSWLAVRAGWGELPEGVTWPAVTLIGLLAGIGFTMSIFIAQLAFDNAQMLAAAKLGVLAASLISALAGLAWAMLFMKARRLREA